MFPFEIITMLVSNILGVLASSWKMKIQNASRVEEAKLAALNEKARISKEIREFDDKGFKITRRTIAISSVFAVILLPVIVSSLPQLVALTSGYIIEPISITFGYTQLDPGFWPFTSDVDVTKWFKNVGGILITPWHTHIVSAIIGFYFGTSK